MSLIPPGRLRLAGALLVLVPSVFVKASGNLGMLKQDQIFTADRNKTQFYIKEGLITGGDRTINDVVVLDVRQSNQSGFERLVIDLEGSHNGEPTAIQRPPYYQVALNGDQKKLEFTVWGSPKIAFDPKKIIKKFSKISQIRQVDFLPLIEKDRWTFVLHLKKTVPVEVFELSNPVRVIVDLKK